MAAPKPKPTPARGAYAPAARAAPSREAGAPAPAPEERLRRSEAAPRGRDERLADLLGEGVLIARYLEAHGRWETHTVRTGAGTFNPRVFVPCACPICTDALAELELEDADHAAP